MAGKCMLINGKWYSFYQILDANYWKSCGWTNAAIAEALNLTEKQVVDILTHGRE